jgi:hypothetical protein
MKAKRRHPVRARRASPPCLLRRHPEQLELKEGETTDDIYVFLTTETNAEVGAVDPKAMPVILTTPEESRPG